MRTLLLLICFIAGPESILSQTNIPAVKTDSTARIASRDSGGTKQDTAAIRNDEREIAIAVSPAAASDASIMIIRMSRIVLDPVSKTTYWGTPDTLGMWSAPYSTSLMLGNYEVVVRKEGFRQVLKSIEIAERQKYSLPIEMLSLEYLRQKRTQWRTYTWISGAIAAAAGMATLYFQGRMHTYKSEYDNAISPEVILEKRDSLSRSRSSYRISCGIAFAAVGCSVVLWLITSSYNE